jgi:hypothetical protein
MSGGAGIADSDGSDDSRTNASTPGAASVTGRGQNPGINVSTVHVGVTNPGTAPTVSGAAATTATTTAPAMPKKPKFGGLKLTSMGIYTPWTGGKPKADWTELETRTPASIQPTQYRPDSYSSQAKGQYFRTEGLKTKFSRGGNVLAFQRDVFDHLEDHGLDTTTYLKDPGDPTQMVSTVTDHGRFNMDKGIQEGIEAGLIHFDEYCEQNDKDAKKFLSNSLEEDLKDQMNEAVNRKDPFTVHWFELMRIVKSGSMERFNKLKVRTNDMHTLHVM